MFCSQCGKEIEATKKYCPECASANHPYNSNVEQDMTVNPEEKDLNIQNVEQTQRKRMNIVIRIVLCIIWLLLMAMVIAIRKEMGITGYIPIFIENLLMAVGIGYIWSR